MPAKAQESPKRRKPVQERSRRRYAAIVDAAARLFGDKGFDATTIDDIATLAETSVGSLYQFFPNKLAVFRAVAEHSLEQSGIRFATVLSDGVDLSDWRDLIHRVLDTFGRMHEEEPSFRAMINNVQLYGEFAEQDLAQSQAFVAGAEQLVMGWAPHLDAELRGAVARVVTHTIEAMLILSQREPPEIAKRMLDETKVMLIRYLEPYVQAPA